MTLRRASTQPGGSLATLALLLALSASACVTRHRSALVWPESIPRSREAMASAGIQHTKSGELDAAASRRLAEASGVVDLADALTPDERTRLLAEPTRLVYAADWRRGVRERIGLRHVLVGELTESRIVTWNEWLAMLTLVTVPFPFARREGVPQPAFELRVVDLETGRIEAEFFAMLSGKTVRGGLSDAQLAAALQAMGLAEAER